MLSTSGDNPSDYKSIEKALKSQTVANITFFRVKIAHCKYFTIVTMCTENLRQIWIPSHALAINSIFLWKLKQSSIPKCQFFKHNKNHSNSSWRTPQKVHRIHILLRDCYSPYRGGQPNVAGLSPSQPIQKLRPTSRSPQEVSAGAKLIVHIPIKRNQIRTASMCHEMIYFLHIVSQIFYDHMSPTLVSILFFFYFCMIFLVT